LRRVQGGCFPVEVPGGEVLEEGAGGLGGEGKRDVTMGGEESLGEVGFAGGFWCDDCEDGWEFSWGSI